MHKPKTVTQNDEIGSLLIKIGRACAAEAGAERELTDAEAYFISRTAIFAWLDAERDPRLIRKGGKAMVTDIPGVLADFCDMMGGKKGSK